jgi:AraC-like DNA-binding protein
LRWGAELDIHLLNRGLQKRRHRAREGSGSARLTIAADSGPGVSLLLALQSLRFHEPVIVGSGALSGVRRGCLLVIGPSERQLPIALSPPFDVLTLDLPLELMGADRERLDQVRSSSGGGLVLLHDRTLRHLMEALLTVGAADDRAAGIVTQGVATAIVSRLQALSPASSRGSGNDAPIPASALDIAIRFVDMNFRDPIRTAHLCDISGLPRARLLKEFRARTGVSPHQYLLRTRVEAARSKLADTEASVSEIALSTGFASQAHFSDVFKRSTGLSPARWRRVTRLPDPSRPSPVRGLDAGLAPKD